MSDLLVNYINAPGTFEVEGGYWIRVEAYEVEEPVTIEEANELTDSLYDIDPCVEEPSEAEPVEETEVTVEVVAEAEAAEDDPSQEKLYQTAEEVFGKDLEACRADLAGNYTISARVIKSHLNEPYILELSRGEVISTVPTYETKKPIFTVDRDTSIDLLWPVANELKISWRGTVTGDDGVIDPPEFNIDGTIVSWQGSASGTIITEFTTQFDLVTIDVPGTPKDGSDQIGTSESINVLAMYHYAPYDFTLDPPDDDELLSVGALLQYCGYLESGELGSTTDPDDPDRYPAAPLNYGCVDYSYTFGSEEWYETFCCRAGSGDGCLIRTAPNPGGGTISEEDKAYYKKERGIGPSLIVDPITTYVPVGPNTAEGCGTIYTKMWQARVDCCETAIPLTPDYDNTTDVIPPDDNGSVAVSGGLDGNNRTFTTSNGSTKFINGKQSIVLSSNGATLYTDSYFCGTTKITVTDGCSTTSFHIRSTDGEWVEIPWEDSIGTLFTGLEPDELTTGYHQCGAHIGKYDAKKILGKYKIEEWQGHDRGDYFDIGSPYYYSKYTNASPLDGCGWTYEQICASGSGHCFPPDSGSSVRGFHEYCIPFKIPPPGAEGNSCGESFYDTIMLSYDLDPPGANGLGYIGADRHSPYIMYDGVGVIFCQECYAEGSGNYYSWRWYHGCDGCRGKLWEWRCI